ncbi:MAG: thioredoxin domain-containing protein [bacterium]|nr:thioredoxin domain-containing protein [bacterium]
MRSFSGKALIVVALIFSVSIVVLALTTKTFGADNNKSLSVVSNQRFREPDESDYIRGNPTATITIIEYSDFECPFCARIHPALKELVESRSDVRWVYRQWPLSSIHGNALASAIASECVGKIVGNSAFWEYSDILFEQQKKLSPELYKKEALRFGIAPSDFDRCIDDEEIQANVLEDRDEIIAMGGTGTPYMIAYGPSRRITSFTGAFTALQLDKLADKLISKN